MLYSYPQIPSPPSPPPPPPPPPLIPPPVIFKKDDYLKRVRYLTYEPYSPVIFILDFDHTLAYYDMKRLLDIDFIDNLPKLYQRPFLFEFLNYISNVNKHNVIILWTAGTKSYIYKGLILSNIAHFFHHILYFDDCVESENKYGVKKSHSYLIDKFPQYTDLRSVFVDNWAMTNAGKSSSYSYIYSVKPFTPRKVVESYGAFNKPPHLINNIDLFIKTKGLRDSKIRKKENKDFFKPEYGDTVLLALINRLDYEVFGGDKYINNNNYLHTKWFSSEKKNDYYYFLMYTKITEF